MLKVVGWERLKWLWQFLQTRQWSLAHWLMLPSMNHISEAYIFDSSLHSYKFFQAYQPILCKTFRSITAEHTFSSDNVIFINIDHILGREESLRFYKIKIILGIKISLVVQWLRLQVFNAGDLESIPGQGTRSHMLQLRVRMPQIKIPLATTEKGSCLSQGRSKIIRAATKTWCSQINIF